MSAILQALVRGYRYFLSPLLAPACRFHPSCSVYAEEALLQHGALRGSWLSARRLCRCGPWHPGGVDPVPDPRAARSDRAAAQARD
jgi:putative membrane protein insertion efficiency factor